MLLIGIAALWSEEAAEVFVSTRKDYRKKCEVIKMKCFSMFISGRLINWDAFRSLSLCLIYSKSAALSIHT